MVQGAPGVDGGLEGMTQEQCKDFFGGSFFFFFWLVGTIPRLWLGVPCPLPAPIDHCLRIYSGCE
jgi:hypothetical protein